MVILEEYASFLLSVEMKVYILFLGGEMRAQRSLVNLGFTFDLFVCAAILVMNCDAISMGADAASVYGTLNRWVGEERSDGGWEGRRGEG